MSTRITINAGGDGLLARNGQQVQANRFAQLERENRQRVEWEAEKQRVARLDAEGRNPDGTLKGGTYAKPLVRPPEPAAQRRNTFSPLMWLAEERIEWGAEYQNYWSYNAGPVIPPQITGAFPTFNNVTGASFSAIKGSGLRSPYQSITLQWPIGSACGGSNQTLYRDYTGLRLYVQDSRPVYVSLRLTMHGTGLDSNVIAVRANGALPWRGVNILGTSDFNQSISDAWTTANSCLAASVDSTYYLYTGPNDVAQYVAPNYQVRPAFAGYFWHDLGSPTSTITLYFPTASNELFFYWENEYAGWTGEGNDTVIESCYAYSYESLLFKA